MNLSSSMEFFGMKGITPSPTRISKKKTKHEARCKLLKKEVDMAKEELRRKQKALADELGIG